MIAKSKIGNNLFSTLVATSISPLEGFLWKPKFENAAKCDLDGVLYELRNNIENNFCKFAKYFY